MTNSAPIPNPGGLTRRRLIGGSLIAGGLLAAGGLAWRILHAGRGEAAPGLQVLSSRLARALDKLSMAYFPADNSIGIDAREADVVGYLDRYLQRLDPTGRRLVMAMLVLFDQGTILAGHLRPVRSLSDADVRSYLARWEASSAAWRRSLITALRSLISQAYLVQPAVQKALTIDAACHTRGPTLVRIREHA